MAEFVDLLNLTITVTNSAENENFTNIFSTDIPQAQTDQNLRLSDTVDLGSSSTKTGFLLYDYLIPTIGSLIILLNLVVVISSGLILKKGQQPRSTYLFLGNVATADLVTGVAVVLGQAFPKDKRDHYVCAVQLGMIVSSTLASVYSVGLIGVDRFLYIIHGIQYQRWVYPTRARLLICLVWCIGLFIGFLPLMGWYGDTDNGRICWFILLAPKELVLLTVVIGAIPITVVTFLYSIILYHAIKKSIQIQRQIRSSNIANTQEDISAGNLRMFRGGGAHSENDEDTEPEPKGILRYFKKKPSASVKSASKWKAIKVVLFTTGSCFITWYPYFIVSVIFVFSCDIHDTSTKCKTMRLLIASPLAILGFMNSFLNPVIYAWWHKGFRTFFKKNVNVIFMRQRHKESVSVLSFDDNTTNSITYSISTSCKNISESSDNSKRADTRSRKMIQ